jgi:hypothetical protein
MITVKEMIMQLLELPMNTKLHRRVEKDGAYFDVEYKMEPLSEGIVFNRSTGEYYLE